MKNIRAMILVVILFLTGLSVGSAQTAGQVEVPPAPAAAPGQVEVPPAPTPAPGSASSAETDASDDGDLMTWIIITLLLTLP